MLKVNGYEGNYSQLFIYNHDGKILKHKVMGFGKDEYRNGTNVNGLPYVDLYGDYFNYDKNINNYIKTETVRVIEEDLNE